MTSLLLFLAFTSNALGNIFLKLSSTRFVAGDIFTNGFLWTGLVFFGLGVLLYVRVLSEMNLSVAYPIMASMGFLIVVSFSVWYLGEQMLWWQWVGASLILIGMLLLSQGNPS